VSALSPCETTILEKLLAKYEQSQAFRTGAPGSRRVTLRLGPASRDLALYDIEDTTTRWTVHAAVQSLAARGLIGYAWEPDNEGNVLQKVWLLPEATARAYATLGRAPKTDVLAGIAARIDTALASETDEAGEPGGSGGTCDSREWLAAYLRDCRDLLVRRHSLTPALPSDPALARDLVQTLIALLRPSSSAMSLRAFSLTCFKDSKYLEKNVLRWLLKVIRQYQPEVRGLDREESVSDETLLSLVGLYRNPELYEFCGPVCLTFGKRTLVFAALPDGAALPAPAIARLEQVDPGSIRQVLLIENRTNYQAYLQNNRRPDELVLYHGGFHGPLRRAFFCRLLAAVPPAVPVWHWGDIDLGGLRIFLQIQREIAPTLRPYRMDRQTLLDSQSLAAPLSAASRQALTAAQNDPRFALFSDLIAAMLETGLRLEQEALID
jgi:hypothetical protein